MGRPVSKGARLTTVTSAERRHVTRVVVAAGIANVLSVLPAFLVGALAVLIREDLAFSERALGAGLSIYFGVGALASVVGGRITERFGARTALRLTALSCVAGSAVIAAAGSFPVLVAGLAVAAFGGAIAQPATNLILAREIPPARQGLAFGIKQASGPTAALIAGTSVPALGLTLGWRWAFALVWAFAALTWLVARADTGGSGRRRAAHRAGDLPLRLLLLLAAAIMPAVGAAMAMGTFFVESAVDFGHSTGAAGWWLTLGGVAAITLRVVMGRWADRVPAGRLVMVTRMLVLGAAGFVLLAFSGSAWLLLPATLLAYGAGWGWPGLYHFGIVRLNPQAPADATGIVVTAMASGGLAGPFLFGVLVEAYSYRAAWLTFAAVLAVSAVLLRSTVTAIRRHAAHTAAAAQR